MTKKTGELPVITQDPNPRRAHCSYCGGKGDSMKAETVLSPIGLKYRIPLNHESCKQSVLSLSLDFGGGGKRKICRKSRTGRPGVNSHAHRYVVV